MIWIEIIKPIHLLPIGHTQEWCDRKGNALIASGHGKKVSKPKPDKPEKKVEKIETAAYTPQAETADLPVEKKTHLFSKKDKKE